ncbi:MAG: hypothetical protein DMD79_20720 [Candidatus Rokuibacteriota bacterium]|nr:MAG: hypothetical protein DMD79_20720 [Candidatus Rokubacteria bacterium]
MFLSNLEFRGLAPRHLRWAWTTMLLGEYMPVTWMSYGLDHLLWGLNPFGYHLTSLLLHVAATLAVYGVAWSLFRVGRVGADPPDPESLRIGAAVAALAFGVHPLRAEPIGWISARGTILGGLFILLAVLVYVTGWTRSQDGRIPARWLGGAVGLNLLALLCRSTSVSLPAVLVVVDVYPLQRLPRAPGGWLEPAARAVWREKLAFVLPAILVIPLAMAARRVSGDPFRIDHYDPLAGVAVALRGASFYLRQTLLPLHLSPIYEMPVRVDPWAPSFAAGALATLAITAALVWARRAWPAGLAAWVSYLLFLLPVSGIVPFGLLHLAADRYTYVSCVSWAVLLGASCAIGWRAWRDRVLSGVVAAAAGGALIVVLGGLALVSWRQVQGWRDAETLWGWAMAVAPESAMAHYSAGALREERGRLDDAIVLYRRAVELWPTQGPFRMGLGRALALHGEIEAAAGELRTAVRLRPGDPVARVQLGLVLFARGDLDGAVAQYEEALRLRPGFAVAHYDLGLVRERQGRWPEAVAHYRRAVEADPELIQARERLARMTTPAAAGAAGAGERTPGTLPVR